MNLIIFFFASLLIMSGAHTVDGESTVEKCEDWGTLEELPTVEEFEEWRTWYAKLYHLDLCSSSRWRRSGRSEENEQISPSFGIDDRTFDGVEHIPNPQLIQAVAEMESQLFAKREVGGVTAGEEEVQNLFGDIRKTFEISNGDGNLDAGEENLMSARSQAVDEMKRRLASYCLYYPQDRLKRMVEKEVGLKHLVQILLSGSQAQEHAEKMLKSHGIHPLGRIEKLVYLVFGLGGDWVNEVEKEVLFIYKAMRVAFKELNLQGNSQLNWGSGLNSLDLGVVLFIRDLNRLVFGPRPDYSDSAIETEERLLKEAIQLAIEVFVLQGNSQLYPEKAVVIQEPLISNDGIKINEKKLLCLEKLRQIMRRALWLSGLAIIVKDESWMVTRWSGQTVMETALMDWDSADMLSPAIKKWMEGMKILEWSQYLKDICYFSLKTSECETPPLLENVG